MNCAIVNRAAINKTVFIPYIVSLITIIPDPPNVPDVFHFLKVEIF